MFSDPRRVGERTYTITTLSHNKYCASEPVLSGQEYGAATFKVEFPHHCRLCACPLTFPLPPFWRRRVVISAPRQQVQKLDKFFSDIEQAVGIWVSNRLGGSLAGCSLVCWGRFLWHGAPSTDMLIWRCDPHQIVVTDLYGATISLLFGALRLSDCPPLLVPLPSALAGRGLFGLPSLPSSLLSAVATGLGEEPK